MHWCQVKGRRVRDDQSVFDPCHARFPRRLLSVTILGDTPDRQSNLVDANGTIRKPPDFRDWSQTLGTYMVLAPNRNEMHYTYASPGSAEFYRKNKRFAGGTVLVKEVFATTHAQLTTGATGRRCTWNVRLLGCSGGAATDAFNKDVPEQLAG
jgi:Cytochrome P460